MRRLTDVHFARATTWEELLDIHARFVRDYHTQVHWAHRERQDERHSPAQVLGWIKGSVYPAPVLHRALDAVQFMRRVDAYGDVRRLHWRFYAEQGLAGKTIRVWLYEGALRLEYETVLLARYSVVQERDGKHIREVTQARRAAPRFRSLQVARFELEPADWLLYVRVPPYAPRQRCASGRVVQLRLPGTNAERVHADEAS